MTNVCRWEAIRSVAVGTAVAPGFVARWYCPLSTSCWVSCSLSFLLSHFRASFASANLSHHPTDPSTLTANALSTSALWLLLRLRKTAPTLLPFASRMAPRDPPAKAPAMAPGMLKMIKPRPSPDAPPMNWQGEDDVKLRCKRLNERLITVGSGATHLPNGHHSVHFWTHQLFEHVCEDAICCEVEQKRREWS